MILRRHPAILFLVLAALMWPRAARASLTLTPKRGIAKLSLSDERAKSGACVLVPRGALPHPRAGRRPSTDKGEAAGEAGWEGAHHPQGFTESYTYETTGEVRTVKDRLARTTTMAHDQLGRLLSMVDTAGRRHGRSYSVPTAAGWQGPALTAAGADATRDGDYEIGVNALQSAGFPAQISLYRDATFALGYSHIFDNAERLQKRTDCSNDRDRLDGDA